MQQVAVTLNRNLLALVKKMKKSCFLGDRFQVFFDLYMEGYI